MSRSVPAPGTERDKVLTRRAILKRLAKGETSVMELAKPFEISLPAVSKHLKVLERAGLIARGRERQWRPARLKAEPLKEVAEWVGEYRRFWKESFERLDAYLAEVQKKERKGRKHGRTKWWRLKLTTPSDREIVMTRIFDAPRELVFKAMTDPQLIPQWWGRRIDTTTVEKMDVRPGGAWRFITRSTDGEEHAFAGEFQEIVPPERVVQTFEWEGLSGHISVDTAILEDVDGKTKLTATSVFDSVEDRDGMLQSGMEEGASQTWDRLAELLATMSEKNLPTMAFQRTYQ